MKRNMQAQRDAIIEILKNENKTIDELAFDLKMSNDLIRTRVKELKLKKLVRVADWIVKQTVTVAVYGYGHDPDEPKPIRRKIEKEIFLPKQQKNIQPEKLFRLEEVDKWLFRAKGIAA